MNGPFDDALQTNSHNEMEDCSIITIDGGLNGGFERGFQTTALP